MNGQPVTAYVETVFVVELSFINRMQAYTQISSTSILYSYIRIYLLHLINGVKFVFNFDEDDLKKFINSIKIRST